MHFDPGLIQRLTFATQLALLDFKQSAGAMKLFPSRGEPDFILQSGRPVKNSV